MAKSKINSNYTVTLRRKREGKTNYKKRLAYLKSGLTRLVVRGSSNNMTVQLVNYGDIGDKVLCSVTSQSLNKLGWNYNGGNIPTAYLCGLLLAKTAKGDISEEVILDLGFQNVLPKTRIFAAVKGSVDGGLNILVDNETLPDDERVSGKHIADYKKSKIDTDFEKIKTKILGA